MYCHFVFKTYRGKRFLTDKETLAFLRRSFNEIAYEKGFELVECEILCDHVHLLIKYCDHVSESDIMKALKGISARRLFQEYNVNRFEIRKLWARSFYSRKVEHCELGKAIEYIRNQKNTQGIDKRV